MKLLLFFIFCCYSQQHIKYWFYGALFLFHPDPCADVEKLDGKLCRNGRFTPNSEYLKKSERLSK